MEATQWKTSVKALVRSAVHTVPQWAALAKLAGLGSTAKVMPVSFRALPCAKEDIEAIAELQKKSKDFIELCLASVNIANVRGPKEGAVLQVLIKHSQLRGFCFEFLSRMLRST